MASISMQVIKRDGIREDVSFDKVLLRIKKCSEGLDVNPTLIAQRTLLRIHDSVKTSELDELAAQLSISLMTTHPDYGTLASRIVISNHHKNTLSSFSDTVEQLHSQIHPKTKQSMNYLSEDFVKTVRIFAKEIDKYIEHDRDYLLDYFGFLTLERQKYLMRSIEGKSLERPQYLWMRVALTLWGEHALKELESGATSLNALIRVFETYDLVSQKYFIHATPTNFNAGSPRPQMSSCYLLSMDSDSITGIYKTLSDCAQISKYAGGIGLHLHNIRARGSSIAGNGGTSTGIVPMLRNFNATARYVDQGSKRNGSFAIYLEPWHADVEDFIKLKLNTGSEEERCRDLFYALWIPDLFMERVEADAKWTLFCPHEAPGLSDVYGDKFRELYEQYEREGKGRKQVDAQKLWFKILDSQIETGTPYLLYKDAANAKSNQQNLGTIKSSNLCVAPETYILTDKGHYHISELVGQDVNIWNGDKWSKTIVIKTGENKKLVTVNLSNGSQLTCTSYHKFIVRKDYSDKTNLKDATRIEASNLKEGMKLTKFNLNLVQGDNTNDNKNDIIYPYTHGFFCGDRTICNPKYGESQKRITLYGNKKVLINKIKMRTSSYEEIINEEITNGCINVMIPDEISDKYYVPINSSLICRLEWLAGLLDSDSCVARNGSNKALQIIQITSIHFEFLDKIRLMLQTLGVQSKVTLSQNERKPFISDGNGAAESASKSLWTLLISSSAVYKLKFLGLTCHHLQITGEEPHKNAEQFVTVVSVIDNGRIDDTYCFNEPENHTGVFNGILTGNCTEIIEYSDKDETAVCNLASIALPTFANAKLRSFNFDKLREVVKIVVRNLNRVIDINFYPIPETERSNKRHRPIGVGIQGLADVFAMMRTPWESDKAHDFNQRLFEHIYYAAVESSCELAKEQGTYETYKGSPISEGKFQFDLWSVTPLTATDDTLDWVALKSKVAEHGVRNSLLLAPMPTASTSQILGFNECFEPFTSNIYTRRTLSGEYIIVNKYLIRDLLRLDLWNDDMKQHIIVRNGSIQGIKEIPSTIQTLYKTSWELKQKTLIDMAAERGAFICQSQSLNLFVSDPTYAKLTSMHFYSWRKGLKTGIYYLRTRAPVMAQKFTVDPELEKEANKSEADRKKKLHEAEEGCVMCSS